MRVLMKQLFNQKQGFPIGGDEIKVEQECCFEESSLFPENFYSFPILNKISFSSFESES